MISSAAALAGMVRVATGTDEAGAHRMLPVAPELSGLLPGRGLRRGSTVSVDAGQTAPAGGGTSLMLALLAAASRSGSWCAVVGLPTLGALAAEESGIALDRLALVPNPGPDWPTVVAALIDGVDVVVTAVPGPVSTSITGRLAARARQRGSVLVPFGDWTGADVTLRVDHGRWDGLGRGRGRLRRREVTVMAHGRGAAARPREITMWMPGITVRSAVIPPIRSTAPGATAPGSTAPGATASGSTALGAAALGTTAPVSAGVPAAVAASVSAGAPAFGHTGRPILVPAGEAVDGGAPAAVVRPGGGGPVPAERAAGLASVPDKGTAAGGSAPVERGLAATGSVPSARGPAAESSGGRLRLVAELGSVPEGA